MALYKRWNVLEIDVFVSFWLYYSLWSKREIYFQILFGIILHYIWTITNIYFQKSSNIENNPKLSKSCPLFNSTMWTTKKLNSKQKFMLQGILLWTFGIIIRKNVVCPSLHENVVKDLPFFLLTMTRRLLLSIRWIDGKDRTEYLSNTIQVHPTTKQAKYQVLNANKETIQNVSNFVIH